MAVLPGLCLSAKLDLVKGVHQPEDRYMLALYSPQADLNPMITHYTKENEVKGQGYQAGGQPLHGYNAYLEGMKACVTWGKDVVWRNATFTARGGVIYNATKGNRALLIVDVVDEHGNSVTSTNGNFKLDGGTTFWIG